MLKYLHIENIAVIEQSNIEFTDGFNVLTGETGAGKSIVIDSINAILGERTSKELIRNGCESAEVSAVFGCLDGDTVNMLENNGYKTDDDGNVVIRRTLSNTGKGIIRINGQPVTAGVLREIGKSLINIHGQHDNQSLLNADNHCGYLDALSGNAKLISEYYVQFKNLNSIRKELEAIETDEDEKLKKIDLLKYQINELETANIKDGELETLKEQLEISKNYEKTMRLLNEAYSALNGTEDADGVVTLLDIAQKKLFGLENEKFSESADKLGEIMSGVEDICSNIRDFTENSEFSELNPDNISERLDFLYKLMLKYGNSESDMLDFLENAKTELDNITFADKRAEELGELLDIAAEKLVNLGERLTKSRKKAAELFSKSVCDVLKYLNMPNVNFVVDIKKGKYTKNGCDIVEFMISANAGEDVKPLHKIASGGELSRVMLAIKSVLSDKDNVYTLIFDEIDSGISGRAADKVGIQLKRVSDKRQVICVTHLAQIAVRADNHLLIEKTTKNGRTFTEVNPLSYNDRISEIARIMSGSDLTENLFNSAKELLDRSITNDNL